MEYKALSKVTGLGSKWAFTRSMQAKNPGSFPLLKATMKPWMRSLMAMLRTKLLSNGSMSSKKLPCDLGYLGFFQPKNFARYVSGWASINSCCLATNSNSLSAICFSTCALKGLSLSCLRRLRIWLLLTRA